MIRALKGIKDILPDQVSLWYLVENAAHQYAQSFGFREIRIPLFEQTELYVRSIGGSTDIVEKEMYTFDDKDGTSLTLRPEGTAGVARAFIEHHLGETPLNHKLYYIGPMFRHENPQAGRFRQFHQFGVEVIANANFMVDVEVISLLWRFFTHLQLPGLVLEVNTIGHPSERQIYKSVLLDFLKKHSSRLCSNCQRRMDLNPLRVLDCKVPDCQKVTADAPKLLSLISQESRDHFNHVLTGLEQIGIPYTLNPRLVRGLDYYSMTTFEVSCTLLGAQNAIGAGGRYDGLFEQLGGKPTPGIGFAVGLERVISVLPDSLHPTLPPLVFVAGFGKKGNPAGLRLLDHLRSLHIRAETDYNAQSLKTYLRSANRLGALWTVISGDDEVTNGQFILRNMTTKQQESLPIHTATEVLVGRIKGPSFS